MIKADIDEAVRTMQKDLDQWAAVLIKAIEESGTRLTNLLLEDLRLQLDRLLPPRPQVTPPKRVTKRKPRSR
jgi:hypothetical protein